MQAKGAVTALLFAALAATGCRCDPTGRNDAGEGPQDAGRCEPPVSTDPCQKGVCDADGTPRLAPVDDGTEVDEQVTGDCKRRVCVGGAVTAVTDDSDLPDDFLDCTADLCLAGAPSNPPLAGGTACGTGGTCDGNGQCVQCTRASQCPGTDTECRVRVCAAGACGFSNAPPGTVVAAQTLGDCRRVQCAGDGTTVTVFDDADLSDDGNACTIDSCDAGTPVRTAAPTNTPCGSGLRCNPSGTCVGCNQPSDCGPAARCKANTCVGGVCGVGNAPDTTACDDGNQCTATDQCVSGNCVGANPVVCTALSQCHLPGVCQPDAGTCTNPVADAGTPCSDGNACTQTDRCQSGTCAGTNPVVCTALSQCHLPGVCQPDAGTCTNPVADAGTPCSDGNACTQVDTCLAGACTGASPVVCTALSQCHLPGVCQPDAGTCTNPVADAGTPCSDGNACTQVDTCLAGACTGASPVVCTALSQCHLPGVCQPDAGTCTNPVADAGTPCSDGNACTQVDTCQAGACTGASPVVCTALSQCHLAGVCQPDAGTCTNPPAANNTPCNDQNLCTQLDTCQGGVCAGANPVVCSALSQCHLAGACQPDAGTCTNPFADAGTPCSLDGGNQCNGAGACSFGLPFVTGTTPAEASVNQSPATPVSVGFNEAMLPASLVTQLDDGPCAGSLQLSSDGFATCLGLSAAAPTMLPGNQGARMTPEPRLSCGTAYQVRVTSAALAADGVRALTAYTSPSGFVTAACFNDYAGVVISQVYASGGLAGATYDADFVELHNRGAAPVNLAGWSLQAASASGTTWTARTFSAGTIAPGGYFLVRTTSAGDAGTALPSADLALAGLDLDAAGGRVLLSSSGATEAGQCPGSAAVVDYVGWGTAVASCVGGAPASAPGATTALARALQGCRDTNGDAADFAVQVAAPRSAASAPFACATANESGQAAEADWCTVQFPLSFSIASGSNSPILYGRLYEAGVTEAAGASALVRAQVGYGPESLNPSTEQAGWTWLDAAYNVQVGNDDEYMASLPTPPVGTFRYAYRFSLNGQPWTYCDTDGSGANGAFRFDPRLLGVMNVTP